jgi:hypothetical protein
LAVAKEVKAKVLVDEVLDVLVAVKGVAQVYGIVEILVEVVYRLWLAALEV